MDTHWVWLKHAVLDAAAEAAPVRSGRRPMKPGFDVATLLLRERRKKLLPELKEAESAGRAAEAATLRSTYRKLTKDIKKSSRRAKAAEWKQRNETLRECARDPSRAKQFWNVVLENRCYQPRPGGPWLQAGSSRGPNLYACVVNKDLSNNLEEKSATL